MSRSVYQFVTRPATGNAIGSEFTIENYPADNEKEAITLLRKNTFKRGGVDYSLTGTVGPQELDDWNKEVFTTRKLNPMQTASAIRYGEAEYGSLLTFDDRKHLKVAAKRIEGSSLEFVYKAFNKGNPYGEND